MVVFVIYRVNYKLLLKNMVAVVIISGILVLSLLFVIALPKIVHEMVNYLSTLH